MELKTKIAQLRIGISTILVFLINLIPINLHCSQYANLLTATFRKVHPEEADILPLIYVFPYSIPLRIALLSLFFIHILTPIWVFRKRVSGKYNLKKAILLMVIGYVLVWIGFKSATFIAGERFESVYMITILTSWLIYLFGIIAIRKTKLAFSNSQNISKE